MKKYCLIVLSIMTMGCVNKPSELDCNDINSIKASIKQQYEADQVELVPKVLKEEIYFDEISIVSLQVFYPTTKALDFKKLSFDDYLTLDNYEERQKSLKSEGKYILNLLLNQCDMKNFDEVHIKFGNEHNDSFDKMYGIPVVYKI